MFKYKSNSTANLILEVNGKLKTIKPNEEFDSDNLLYNKFLIEITPKPSAQIADKKDIKKVNKKIEVISDDS